LACRNFPYIPRESLAQAAAGPDPRARSGACDPKVRSLRAVKAEAIPFLPRLARRADPRHRRVFFRCALAHARTARAVDTIGIRFFITIAVTTTTIIIAITTTIIITIAIRRAEQRDPGRAQRAGASANRRR